jgi:hypothetical protein
LEHASSFSSPGAPDTPIVHTRHAAWLIRRHRSDDAPFAVLSSSRVIRSSSFRTLNHVHPVAPNPKRLFPELPAHPTCRGSRPNEAIGRVEVWRGGCRSNISVAAPFVWRCLTGSAMAPFPHPAHRTGHADFPHPALGQDFTPSSRVTPSAVSEHFSELLGCPIPMSVTTSCVCLELRPLPSPGVTRLPRYYEPLRHPSAPGLSLAGVRLIIPDHASGFPVLRALSLCTCCRHYPGAAAGRIPRSSHPAAMTHPPVLPSVE